MESDEIKSYFRNYYPDLAHESGIKNDHYSYLKFSDAKTNMVTVLIFMNENNICETARYIYDLSLERKVLEELNLKFNKTGKDIWEDGRKNNRVMIVYEKGEWYITVNYKEYK